MSTLKVNAISDAAGANGNAISLASDGTCTLKATNIHSFKNLAYNGAMQLDQRSNVTGISSGTTKGGPDGSRLEVNNYGTYTLKQGGSGVSPVSKGFSTCAHIDCTSADASPAAGDYMVYTPQIVEGYNVDQLGWGTADAKDITVSFWCKADISGWSSGTKNFVVEIQTGSTTNELGKLVSLSTNDTWQKIELTFEGPTGVAPASVTNGNGFSVNMWLGAGTDFTSGTLPTSWANQSSANRAPGTSLQLGSNTANNFYLTGLQIEAGSVATDFEHRSFDEEVGRCQRYYQRFTTEVRMDTSSNGVIAFADIVLPVRMRTTPSLTNSWVSSYNVNEGDLQDSMISSQSITLGIRGTGGGARGRRTISLDAEI